MNNRERQESLTLEILEAIEAQSDVTQRHLARHMGIALGLANSYLKRCVRKGLVKIQQAPANRYFYYLTPKGFSEKGRLTGQYLATSFKFYHRAAESCTVALTRCKNKGWTRITLCGASDLAEIASLRASDHKLEIVSIYDPLYNRDKFLSYPVFDSIEKCKGSDAWILTDLTEPQRAYERLVSTLGAERVIAPDILGVHSTA
jgi:predicted transcriptional regulator